MSEDAFVQSMFDAIFAGRTAVVAHAIERDPAFLHEPIEMLAESTLGEELLLEAARLGQDDLVNRMIDNGVDVNAFVISDTPLLAAIQGVQPETVSLLLERGADPNHPRYLTPWPIQAAAAQGDTRILASLVRAGADVNQPDLDQNHPLHSACGSANPDAVRWLLERGADCTLRDDRGRTPLFTAIEVGDDASVRHLLAFGASPAETSRVGYLKRPVEDVASRSDYIRVGPIDALAYAELMVSDPRARGVIVPGFGERGIRIKRGGTDEAPCRGGRWHAVRDLLREAAGRES